jgi:hypothetical protein
VADAASCPHADALCMDLTAISVPDWLGPALWWGKWIVIGTVVLLAGIGQREKNRGSR